MVAPWPVPALHNLRRASVLIPFQWIQAEWHILFTRRTDTVQDHKGQVSFPGGAADSQDIDEAGTAAREAYEEIGVALEDIQILGRMGQIGTMTGYMITPVVASIPFPYPFQPSMNEVDRIFTIPLSWLANPVHHFEKQRATANGTLSPVIYFDEYDGELLWGITAFITLNLINLLKM